MLEKGERKGERRETPGLKKKGGGVKGGENLKFVGTSSNKYFKNFLRNTEIRNHT